MTNRWPLFCTLYSTCICILHIVTFCGSVAALIHINDVHTPSIILFIATMHKQNPGHLNLSHQNHCFCYWPGPLPRSDSIQHVNFQGTRQQEFVGTNLTSAPTNRPIKADQFYSTEWERWETWKDRDLLAHKLLGRRWALALSIPCFIYPAPLDLQQRQTLRGKTQRWSYKIWYT